MTERIEVQSIDEAVALASARDSQGNATLPRETLVIINAQETPIIPQKYWEYSSGGIMHPLTRTDASLKFMKHGPEVKFPRFSSTGEAIESIQGAGKVPVDIRAEIFNISHGPYCAFSYAPVFRNYGGKRKIPLIEIMDGAKLYGYSGRQGTPIKVTPYLRSKRVGKEGAIVDVTVPSRTPRRESYTFSIFGVPVVDTPIKYALSMSLISNHNCPDMQHRKRFTWDYGKENSRVFNWDAHDTAGVFATIDSLWEDYHNLTPLAMSIIPLPSQLLVDVHQTLRYQTVTRTRENPEQAKAKLYPLNNAEMEIGLHNAVQLLGHQATLFSSGKRDGNLRDYNWRGF